MSKVVQLFQSRKTTSATLNHPDYIVSSITKSILQVRLNRLHTSVKCMSANSVVISKVMPSLNRIFHPAQILFIWFPATNTDQSSLLIKSGELGLILSTAADAVPYAMLMVPEFSADCGDLLEPEFSEAMAEKVLIKLAKQAQSIVRC